FAMQNMLPNSAESVLKELPQEVAIAVMRQGPLQHNGDSYGALMQRVQQVMMDPAMAAAAAAQSQALQQQQQQLYAQQQQQMQQQQYGYQQAPMQGYDPNAYQQQMHQQVQPNYGYQQAPMQAQSSDPLTDFCRQNRVDGAVEQVLRSAAPDLQALVMAEGPLYGNNPSEVLIARVKRIMNQP
ncbi:unnamed protein product, partial [Polarella glacialis]